MAIQLRLEFQRNPVGDEVSAITAVVRPILQGLLYALKGEVVAEVGGYDKAKLFMLSRLRRPGDGEIGICFEYAVHDAVTRGEPTVTERISDALEACNVPGGSVGSILFGAEKSGALSLISTSKQLLTADSLLMYGTQGRPVKLRRHLDRVVAAFRRPDERLLLPSSISGLWKADMFTGSPASDRWIGTSLNINREHLEAAKGLRLGIVPSRSGASDSIEKDDSKNLIVCPLPYDHSFMQVFYQAWEVVVQFLAADARVPRDAFLPRPASRQVAQYLQDRRDFPVLDVLAALGPLSQPELLETREESAALVDTKAQRTETTNLLAPVPRRKSNARP